MALLNEQKIYEEWAPGLQEKTGISDKSKLKWLSVYAHNHMLYESYNPLSIAYPMIGLQNVPGMGNAVPAMTGNGGMANFYDRTKAGSGDKFPSTLPIAIQTAAQTHGFDIVSTIPMSNPTMSIVYMDYVYSGGKIPSNPTDPYAENPILIKANLKGDYVVGNDYEAKDSNGSILHLIYVGKSRINAYPIFRVLKHNEVVTTKGNTNSPVQITSKTTPGITIADVFKNDNSNTFAISWSDSTPPDEAEPTSGVDVSLVSAYENHIQGFSGAGPNDDYDWSGNYVNPLVPYNPMDRGIGEQTYPRTLGLQTFSKIVNAATVQVNAGVTVEQIQDLGRQWNYDVVSMVKNACVNELSQSINKHILYRAFALGWSNHSEFCESEGQNLNLSLDFNYTTGNRTFKALGMTDNVITMNIPYYTNYGNFENQTTLQRRLQSRILAAAGIIYQRGRRGPANFIVTNLQIGSILKDSAGFQMAPLPNTIDQTTSSLSPMGTFMDMTVYIDPNMAWNDTRVLVGRKGADDEPGLKFCVYMMAESIETIDSNTMSPKLAVKSRYALVEAGFYPQTQYFTFYVDVPRDGANNPISIV
jgi:hypothetical protein